MISKINQILEFTEKNNEKIYKKLEQTSLYCFALAKAINLNPKDKELAYYAGLLHDIGKTKISKNILNKPKDSMSVDEMKEFQKHTLYSECMLMFIDGFEELPLIIKSHQENWDGSGYPDKIKKQEIPVISRVLLIASDYYTMRYEEHMEHEEAVEKLISGSNIKYDGNMIEPFIDIIEQEELL